MASQKQKALAKEIEETAEFKEFRKENEFVKLYQEKDINTVMEIDKRVLVIFNEKDEWGAGIKGNITESSIAKFIPHLISQGIAIVAKKSFKNQKGDIIEYLTLEPSAEFSKDRFGKRNKEGHNLRVVNYQLYLPDEDLIRFLVEESNGSA